MKKTNKKKEKNAKQTAQKLLKLLDVGGGRLGRDVVVEGPEQRIITARRDQSTGRILVRTYKAHKKDAQLELRLTPRKSELSTRDNIEKLTTQLLILGGIGTGSLFV